MSRTKIEWTDRTWNPSIGCQKIVPGCANCYAEKMATRLAGMDNTTGFKYRYVIDKGKWNDSVLWDFETLKQPFEWKKPCKVFVGSMTDIFHDPSPDDLDRLFAVIACNPHITFQILTKRPWVALNYFLAPDLYYRIWNAAVKYYYIRLPLDFDIPINNLWIGVTVCNQAEADKHIPILEAIPAKVRYISVEPMLGPITLPKVMDDIHWVIIGGETGQNARKMETHWATDLAITCSCLGIPVFFKSWGAYKRHEINMNMYKQFPNT